METMGIGQAIKQAACRRRTVGYCLGKGHLPDFLFRSSVRSSACSGELHTPTSTLAIQLTLKRQALMNLCIQCLNVMRFRVNATMGM